MGAVAGKGTGPGSPQAVAQPQWGFKPPDSGFANLQKNVACQAHTQARGM